MGMKSTQTQLTRNIILSRSNTMSIKNPITKPSQMRRQVDWTHMTEAQKSRLKTSWWSTRSVVIPANEKEAAAMQRMFALRDKLLAFCGDEVVMPVYEEDYDAIMQHGQFFYGAHARLKLGAPSQCHYNSALLWDANRGRCQIATGYALSEDGLWRQHSWVMQPLTVSWRIWETTKKRIAYFGVVFNDDECEDFLWNNH